MQVRDTLRCFRLCILKRLPLLRHFHQCIGIARIDRICQSRNRVDTVGAPVRKAGQHRSQPFDLCGFAQEQVHVGRIILPVLPLSLDVGGHVGRAGRGYSGGFVPDRILSLYRFQRRGIGFVVGVHKQLHMAGCVVDHAGQEVDLACRLLRHPGLLGQNRVVIPERILCGQRCGLPLLNRGIQIFQGILGLFLFELQLFQAFRLLIIFRCQVCPVAARFPRKLFQPLFQRFPLFLDLREPDLRSGPVQLVFSQLLFCRRLIGQQVGQLIRPGLLLRVFLHGCDRRFERSGAALDRVGGQVDLVRQFGHDLRQQGQRVPVILISGHIAARRGFDLLQPGNIQIGGVDARLCFGGNQPDRKARLLCRLTQIACGPGQLLYLRYAFMRPLVHPVDRPAQSADRSAYPEDNTCGAGEHRRKIKRFCYLGDCRIGGYPSGQGSDRTDHAGDRAHHARRILHKLVYPGEYVGPNLVQISHSRGELLPDRGFQRIPCGFHQDELSVHVVQLDLRHPLCGPGAAVDALGQTVHVRLTGVDDCQHSGHGLLAKDGACRRCLLRLAQLREGGAQGGGQLCQRLHAAVRVGHRDAKPLHLPGLCFGRGGQVGQRCF